MEAWEEERAKGEGPTPSHIIYQDLGEVRPPGREAAGMAFAGAGETRKTRHQRRGGVLHFPGSQSLRSVRLGPPSRPPPPKACVRSSKTTTSHATRSHGHSAGAADAGRRHDPLSVKLALAYGSPVMPNNLNRRCAPRVGRRA